MATRNTPQKPLESWKQIAAYLERSEKTVRRWEATEGLPVHRRGHSRQDTVFAYKHELDRWHGERTKRPDVQLDAALHQLAPANLAEPSPYLAEHDAITRTIHLYVAGARAGDGEMMRPAFHKEATMSGYCQDVEYSGPIEHVFTWMNQNGPVPQMEARFVRIELIETIALVHLDTQHWSGKLVGTAARSSDVFTLLKQNGTWKITHKAFHWY